MLRLIYPVFISAFLFTCCTASTSVKGTRGFQTFPAVYTQEETRLLDVGLSTPELMAIYKDSLLLVTNNLNRNPYHVSVFDSKQRKVVNHIMPVSRKKGGTLSFMTFRVSDSLVWVFDVAKNGFIVASIDTVLKGDREVECYSEYPVKPQVFYYDAMLVNRNEAFLSGNYETDEKLVYVNFSDSARNKVLLSYQQDTAIGASRVNKMSYESFMMLKPDKEKLLLACRYADQFELLDLKNGMVKKVKGPVGLTPQLVPYRNNSGVTVATIGQETIYGFLKGHVTGNYFYLLFSGYNVRSPHRFYGNKIFVYDWEGNRVKEINVKHDIVDFTVSSDDKLLYTLNPLTKTISLSEIK